MNKKSSRFKVKWDETGQIARVKVWGNPDENATKEYAKSARELVARREKDGGGIKKVLYDINEAGKPDYNSRRIIAEVAREIAHKNPDIKVAYVGMGSMQKTVAKVIDWLAEIGEVKFFATEKEALKWLNE